MLWHEAKASHLAGLRGKERVGLVTDLDGTISPLAPHPDLAEVTPRCRSLLQALSGRLSLVAVVSGRSVRDVRRRVGLPDVTYVGNHGLERWADGDVRVSPEAAAYRPRLEAALAPLERLLEPGMLIEDKGVTCSIHYRRTAHPAEAQVRLRSALEGLAAAAGLVLSPGHMVFELRPPVAQGKGTALRALVSEFDLDAAIFMGDDVTDAAALAESRRMREDGSCYSLGLGVVSAATPSAVLEWADLLAEGVSGVEDFLSWLAESRMASLT